VEIQSITAIPTHFESIDHFKQINLKIAHLGIQSNTHIHVFYFAFRFLTNYLYAESVLEETNKKLT